MEYSPTSQTSSNQNLQLGYAPPAKNPTRAAWVIMMGLATTALALAGVYALQTYADTNVMGFYLNYLFPAGAIAVGLAASSGYAFMSWKLGVKIHRKLLWAVVLLLFVSYFAAEYVEFKSRGPLVIPVTANTVVAKNKRVPVLYRPLEFWEYFHLKAVNWTWQKEHSYDKESEPLGMAGYFFVLLGIVGFSASGIILPKVVSNTPYCELCERYMQTRKIGVWPASAAAKKIRKRDVAAQTERHLLDEVRIDEAKALLDRLTAAGKASDSVAFNLAASQSPDDAKAANKLPRRLQVDLVKCASCSSGFLSAQYLTGQGKKLERRKFPRIDLSPDFLRAIASKYP